VKVLLDTNILLRLAVVSHPTHSDAVSAVHKIRHRGDDPVIVPQVLYEYWVVAMFENNFETPIKGARDATFNATYIC
jgi:predicted nucleic acid-binding protein